MDYNEQLLHVFTYIDITTGRIINYGCHTRCQQNQDRMSRRQKHLITHPNVIPVIFVIRVIAVVSLSSVMLFQPHLKLNHDLVYFNDSTN